MTNFYDSLNLKITASEEEIDKAYEDIKKVFG